MAKLPDGFLFIAEPSGLSITLREQELIMCRSCTFFESGMDEAGTWSCCKLHSMNTSKADFCSWGVKKIERPVVDPGRSAARVLADGVRGGDNEAHGEVVENGTPADLG